MTSRRMGGSDGGASGCRLGRNGCVISAAKVFTSASRPRARSSAWHASTASWAARRGFNPKASETSSIADPVRLALPLGERVQRFAAQQLFHRNLPLGNWQRHFAIKKIVVEINARRVFAGVAVINFFKPRPVDRGETHRARLATGVEF